MYTLNFMQVHFEQLLRLFYSACETEKIKGYFDTLKKMHNYSKDLENKRLYSAFLFVRKISVYTVFIGNKQIT